MANSKAKITYVGLDVHAETISIAVAEAGRAPARNVGTIPNQPDSIRKAMKKLGAAKSLQVCYEAGPTGYALYWQLEKLGITCEVIAPTLIPVKTGDRIKTDKRDARKLAQNHRAGELTPVFIPDAEHEALRDLVRAREAAKKDQLRARHRLSKFLLRLGRRFSDKGRTWGQLHSKWLGTQTFEYFAQEQTFLDYRNEVDHASERVAGLETSIEKAIELAPPRMQELIAALQSLRGVAKITAVTLVSEVGSFERFTSAPKFMAYLGLVPSESTSGASRKQGRITKTGNAHIRRVLGESALTGCRQPRRSPVLLRRQKGARGCGSHIDIEPRRSPVLLRRQKGQSQTILDISWKAQKRLYSKYGRLKMRGKSHQLTSTAMGRELAGFIWAIARQREQELKSN